MTLSPSVGIVILNWNGKAYLQQFLPFVLATTYANYRLIVADNASTDDSLPFLKIAFPQVEIISLKQNFGFAKGYNEALKKIDTDYYVLLNSDVEVTPGWLQPMIELLEKDTRSAACQPKILNYQNRHLFEYAGAAGGYIDAYGYPFARGRIFDVCEEDKGQYDTTEEVFWASGAALVIRRTVFEQLSGFDDYFFAHQEEIDLCWRIQLSGKKVFCCPQSVVYHVGGGTLPQGNTHKTFLNFRNNLVMLAKNGVPGERWKVVYRVGLDQVAGIKAMSGGDGATYGAIVKAQLHFFKWLLFTTKKPQHPNRRKLRTLKGVYTGSLVWQYFIKKKKYFSELFTPR